MLSKHNAAVRLFAVSTLATLNSRPLPKHRCTVRVRGRVRAAAE